MLLGVVYQNIAFFSQKLMCQTPLKYEKKLFNQVKKLKVNFFCMSNTHLESLVLINQREPLNLAKLRWPTWIEKTSSTIIATHHPSNQKGGMEEKKSKTR